MSSPIIIKTSQPDTEERLVLVPPGACTDYEDKPGRVRLVTTDARDATPADLGRGGFVLEKQPSQVAYLDMWNQRDAAITRAEKAEVERDAFRAELARLAAPGEDGGPWRAYGEPTDQELVDAFEHAYSNAPSVRTHATAIRTLYRLGVAHERARHVEKDRATDEELEDLYNAAFDAGPSGVHDSRVVALRAVAARVRQERCLVAQAVAANVDIRVAEDDGGGFMIGVHAPGCDEEFVRCVPVAEVPATLARLLGEVGRG